jgi:RimJ/RimL family protein N-acetyltransferase
MPAPTQSKRIVRIDSEKYLIRTIEPDDGSDRWASWMSDPEVMHMLNLRPRTWMKADVLDYIKTFDQQSSLLLGIFEKQSGTHIGIFTVDINQVQSRFRVNLLIGEPGYRNKRVTSSIAMPFHEYFFETLGLNMAIASVLAHNVPMIHYLEKKRLEARSNRQAQQEIERRRCDARRLPVQPVSRRLAPLDERKFGAEQ